MQDVYDPRLKLEAVDLRKRLSDNPIIRPAGYLPKGTPLPFSFPPSDGSGISLGLGRAGIPIFTRLIARHLNKKGESIGLREILNRVVTNAGRDSIVDAFTAAFTLADYDWHGWGTGTTAENVTDTGLETPSAEARTDGTPTQPTSDVYQSVGTITATAARAITEHVLFSASTAGTALDRTVFTVINVGNGESIQFTFQITFAAGG